MFKKTALFSQEGIPNGEVELLLCTSCLYAFVFVSVEAPVRKDSSRAGRPWKTCSAALEVQSHQGANITSVSGSIITSGYY